MELRDFFFDTSHQRILKFLAEFPNKTFFEREIAQKAKISRGAANAALRKLAKAGLIIRERKGRMSFYSVDLKNPLIKQWKVLSNAIRIYPLIKRLKKESDKIILFGSAASGINIKESDIDLFILTNFPEKIKKIISENKEKIQLIAKKPLESVELKSKDPIFYDEVMRGIVLWEKTK